VVDEFGDTMFSEYREGLKPLLSTPESELSAMQALLKMSIRRTMEEKLGKTIYSFSRYEKVKRVTIPLRKEGIYDAILMVSLDLEADHNSIIEKKILPFIESAGFK
jgi:hypothetical protein